MTTKNDLTRTIRIGFVVALSLICLMTFLFFIGSEQKLFARKNEYHVHLPTVSGLAEGNPVQLTGVTVGVVRTIQLPRNPKNRNVAITIEIDKKFSERIRRDSRARLKKLGLIAADSYIDITPGSPNLPVLPPGSNIPSAKQTNVDNLISSGEDLVDNFVQISYSLKNVLHRVDRGEGLIGELTRDTGKPKITDTLQITLTRTNETLSQIQSGRGLVGKLVYDEAYANELTGSLRSSVGSLQAIMTNIQGGFESGDGAIPALLHDPEGRGKVNALLDNLNTATLNLSDFTASLQTGEGLVPRLMNDREYADEALGEFKLLVQRLSGVAQKLDSGEGTAGRLISDPSLYEAVNDIIIGINESKLLRWLVRNRQQKGIETRYEAASGTAPAGQPRESAVAPAEAPPAPAPASGGVPPVSAPDASSAPTDGDQPGDTSTAAAATTPPQGV